MTRHRKRPIIQGMFDYIRTWWLINRISKECLKRQVESREANKVLGIVGKVAYALPIESFLEKRARKYLFSYGRLRSQDYRNERIEKDRKLLQRSNDILKYTQALETPSGVVITTFPDGDFFAKPMNGFAGFLKSYYQAFVVIVTTLLFLTSLNWFPSEQVWLKQKWHNVVHHYLQEKPQTNPQQVIPRNCLY